jgi:hypothetical protein
MRGCSAVSAVSISFPLQTISRKFSLKAAADVADDLISSVSKYCWHKTLSSGRREAWYCTFREH